MLIELMDTDFLDVDCDALAHGVNMQGFMGAGVARQIARRWPSVNEEYVAHCRNERARLGGFFLTAIPVVGDGPSCIYNLYTQIEPGADARLSAIDVALDRMATAAWLAGHKRIAMPRIGCGIGGLKWADVRYLMESASKDVDFVVCVV